MRDLLDRRAALDTDVRRHDDRIPHALAAIVNKCLRPDPTARYAGGKQLAQDLDAFLQRQPLVHAENPSRVERCADWAARNRRFLIANAFYLGILALLSPLLLEKASRLWQPALKRSPAFNEAVKAVDEGDYARAVSLLLDVSRSYPEEPLPQIYLGIAYSGANRLPEDPAIAAYTRGAALPGADAGLREWSREHPKFVDQLKQFGSTSLEKTRGIVNVTHRPDGAPASKDRESMDKSIGRVFDTVNHALQSVLAVDAKSREALRDLAIVAEYRKDFATAHQRLTQLLAIPQGEAGAVPPGDLIALRMQRARVAAQRARDVAFSAKRPDLAEAIRIAGDAVADLDACLQALADFQRPYYLGYRTQALLTRGEIHRRLGDGRLAHADAREAKQHLEQWIALARSSGAPVEESLERVYRDRISDLWRNPDSVDRPGDDPSQTKPSE
jgi:tetratricopeptide (TPR) repeat protein